MRKIVLAGAIGVMVLAGASVAVAQTAEDAPLGRMAAFVEDVIDGLVSDGTLTDDQGAAVMSALESAHEEQWAEREALRAERQAERELFRSAMEDGVITSDELAAFPEGSVLTDPDGPFAEYLADGELTHEEMQEAHEGFRGGFGRRGSGPQGAGVDTGA